MPKPSSAEFEAKHELRRSESLKVFSKTVKAKPNSKSASSYACKPNLTESESKGLKSLQSSVSNGSLVICETDKSSKLCVLSRDQYIKSGLQHCQSDLEISLTDVKRLQKYVNSNVEWLHDIFNTGDFGDIITGSRRVAWI